MDTSVRHLLALAVFTVAVTPLPAQKTEPLGDARVTLVAGTAPSRGGPTEVLRRAQRTPRNVVVVDGSATPEDLAAALALINALRSRYGDALTADLRARPGSARPGPTWQRSAYRAWLVVQLARLRAAPPVDVPGLGVARAVHITLPAPSRVPGVSTALRQGSP